MIFSRKERYRQITRLAMLLLMGTLFNLSTNAQAPAPERNSPPYSANDTLLSDVLLKAPASDTIDDDNDADEEYFDYEEEEDSYLFVPADTAELRLTPDSIIKQLQSRPEFSYANDESLIKKERKTMEDPLAKVFFNSALVQQIVFILAILLLIFLIFRFSGLFKPRKKQRQPYNLALEEGDTRENLDEKILIAIREMRYRDAIRLLFIQSLYNLDDKKWIRFDQKTPNSIYRVQMKGKPGSDSFNWITHIYEYVWYGGMDINEAQFKTAKAGFDEFKELTA